MSPALGLSRGSRREAIANGMRQAQQQQEQQQQQQAQQQQLQEQQAQQQQACAGWPRTPE